MSAGLDAQARHEIAEDRRLAALMRQPKNRAQLERRADVTEALLARAVAAEADRDQAIRKWDDWQKISNKQHELAQSAIAAARHHLAERDEARARVAAVEAAIPEALAPIGTLRHGINCSMRPAIYEGARCNCDLIGQVRSAVETRLRAALAAAPICSTCSGAGEIEVEGQIGAPGSGGVLPCPDCAAQRPLAAASPREDEA